MTGNTIGVYVLTMLVCSLCNVSGHSMGIFKMLLLIVLLNYDLDEATGLAQAMVVGSALPNFFAIILKKHPIKPANLVNYDLIYVIIPCTLLGSTVGSLLQNFTPKIVQDGLLVALFSFMVYNFAKKFALLVKPGKPMILS